MPQRVILKKSVAGVTVRLPAPWRAGRVLKEQPNDWEKTAVVHVGFTLIALFEGLILVGGIDAGVPGWLVAVVTVVGVLLGGRLIGLAQRRPYMGPLHS
jgi:hypothetical protein